MVPWAHPSPHTKQHLDRFSHFCRAHYCGRQNDHATWSVTTGRIYIRSTAIRPNNMSLTTWLLVQQIWNFYVWALILQQRPLYCLADVSREHVASSWHQSYAAWPHIDTVILLCNWWGTVKTFLSVKTKKILECGPMPNVMVALPNIGGALCSTPQTLADAHY